MISLLSANQAHKNLAQQQASTWAHSPPVMQHPPHLRAIRGILQKQSMALLNASSLLTQGLDTVFPSPTGSENETKFGKQVKLEAFCRGSQAGVHPALLDSMLLSLSLSMSEFYMPCHRFKAPQRTVDPSSPHTALCCVCARLLICYSSLQAPFQHVLTQIPNANQYSAYTTLSMAIQYHPIYSHQA